MHDLRGDHIIVLDDKNVVSIEIADAELGLDASGLTLLLNRYVFSYRGAPLKDLVIRTEGGHIVQTGTVHKLIDIPFKMTASISVTPDGLIRLHPTRMEICNLDRSCSRRSAGRWRISWTRAGRRA